MGILLLTTFLRTLTLFKGLFTNFSKLHSRFKGLMKNGALLRVPYLFKCMCFGRLLVEFGYLNTKSLPKQKNFIKKYNYMLHRVPFYIRPIADYKVLLLLHKIFFI